MTSFSNELKKEVLKYDENINEQKLSLIKKKIQLLNKKFKILNETSVYEILKNKLKEKAKDGETCFALCSFKNIFATSGEYDISHKDLESKLKKVNCDMSFLYYEENRSRDDDQFLDTNLQLEIGYCFDKNRVLISCQSYEFGKSPPNTWSFGREGWKCINEEAGKECIKEDYPSIINFWEKLEKDKLNPHFVMCNGQYVKGGNVYLSVKW